MDKRTRILIVDDHPLVRERLGEIINAEPDLEVCGEADDAPPALQFLATCRPDFAIVDLHLRDSSGLALIKNALLLLPGLRILVITMDQGADLAVHCLRAGALGFLTKQEVTTEIIVAIRAVLAGHGYVPASIAGAVTRRLASTAGHGQEPVQTLSDRELEIFEWLGSGATIGQIANKLGVTEPTIYTNCDRIKLKLGYQSLHELTLAAIRVHRCPGCRRALQGPGLS